MTIVPAEPTLDELAVTIRREDQLALDAGLSMLDHAYRAGEALIAAKGLVPRGEWTRWLSENVPAENGGFPYRVYRYMRMARNQQKLLASGVASIEHADRILREEADQGRPGVALMTLDDDLVAQARRGEISVNEAARRLGVSHATVSRRLDGGHRLNVRRARERAARRALRERERQDAARKIGGPVAELYALIRRALQAADRAHAAAPDAEARAAIAAAMGRLHGAEDEASRAVRLWNVYRDSAGNGAG